MEYVYQDLKGPSGSSGSAGIPRDYSQYLVKSSAYTAHKGDHILVLSGADITLPSSPVAGDWVSFTMGTGVSSFLLRPTSGDKINTLAGATFIIGEHTFSAVYKDSSTGWVANPSAAGTTQGVLINSSGYNEISSNITVNSRIGNIVTSVVSNTPYISNISYNSMDGTNITFSQDMSTRAGNDLIDIVIQYNNYTQSVTITDNFNAQYYSNMSNRYFDSVFMPSSYGDLSSTNSITFRFYEKTIYFDSITFPNGNINPIFSTPYGYGYVYVTIDGLQFNCDSLGLSTYITLNPYYIYDRNRIVNGASLLIDFNLSGSIYYQNMQKSPTHPQILVDPIGAKQISGYSSYNDTVSSSSFGVDGTWVNVLDPNLLNDISPSKIEVLDSEYNFLASYDGITSYDVENDKRYFLVDPKYGDLTGVFQPTVYLRYSRTEMHTYPIILYQELNTIAYFDIGGSDPRYTMFAQYQPVTLTY